MRRTIWGCVLLAAALTAACSDNNDTIPTTPDPVQIVTTFTGTVARNEEQIHQVTATRSGAVNAQLTAVEPDSAIVYLGLGTWNGVSCNLIISRTDATQGSSVTGASTSAGELCVRVAASGSVTGSIGYEVTVSYY